MDVLLIFAVHWKLILGVFVLFIIFDMLNLRAKLKNEDAERKECGWKTYQDKLRSSFGRSRRR